MNPVPSYLPRLVDRELADLLAAAGAVLIEGPRACGKTRSARQFARSEVLFDVDANARATALAAPALLLEGDTPRLFDEWQLVPELWNHIRRAVDDRGSPGQFLLTGSAVPADDVTRHTGAGRIVRLRMRPMSLFESGASSGECSLGALLQGDTAAAADPGLSFESVVDALVVGGWPALHGQPVKAALRVNRQFLDDTRRVDLERVDGVSRDPMRVERTMRSLARHVATPAALRVIATDAGSDDTPLSHVAITGYLEALTRLHILEDQPAWAPHLRSRSILRSTAKRHFVDPSLAVAALRASPATLIRDMRLLGLLFESLVVRDARIYAQACDAEVLHYRDNTGLEVDLVVQAADGRWGAIEVKLGAAWVDEAASSLRRFAERIDTSVCGRPAFLAVVVPTGFGYVRPDGVAVIPIGAFGP
jgi:uncharacterized protein